LDTAILVVRKKPHNTYPSALTSLSDVDQTIITILAGVEATPYRFYQAVLSKASPKFRTAFAGNFAEGTSKKLSLVYEHPRTLMLFQNWLNSGCLGLPNDSTANISWSEVRYDEGIAVASSNSEPPKCTGCGGYKLSKADELVPWQEDLLDLIRFADEHDVPLLEREAIIMWQTKDEKISSVAPYEIVLEAFAVLPTESAFCHYLIDSYRHYGGSDWRSAACDCCFDETDEFPTAPTADDLPFAFTNGMVENAVPIVDPYFNWCQYHGHISEEEKDACQTIRFKQGRFGADEHFYQQWKAEMEDRMDVGAYERTELGEWY
jgi:hypothetical protein